MQQNYSEVPLVTHVQTRDKQQGLCLSYSPAIAAHTGRAALALYVRVHAAIAASPRGYAWEFIQTTELILVELVINMFL